jgi:Tryptophan-associated transmembrane protein (Trp_oprn_chp)
MESNSAMEHDPEIEHDVAPDVEPDVEPAPALDASRPTALRLWGFLLCAIGALLAGIASVLTWVTVGLRKVPAMDSASRGLDLVDGKVVLVAAVVMLVGVMATRLIAPRARRLVAVVVLLAGIVTIVVSGLFLARASDRFHAVDSEAVVEKFAQATGRPADVVRAHMEGVVAQLGGFTDVGPGAWVALAGGAVGTAGGVLVVLWSRRASDGATNDEDAATGPDPED